MKMQSCGDSVVAACGKGESKDLCITARNYSDVEKYFEESIQFSMNSNQQKKHNNTNAFKGNQELHALSIINENECNDEKYLHNGCKPCNKENMLSVSSNRRNPTCSGQISTLNRTGKNVIHGKTRKRRNQSGSQASAKIFLRVSNSSEISRTLSNKTANAERSYTIGISSYLSIVPTQDRCKLESWGLPSIILQKYEAKGISTMFPWQVECLSNHRVMVEGKNLVYSAPTSAGKTLVAEILLLKTVLEQRKKAIFILPFISVVREKMYYFQDLLSDSGIRVEGFMGGTVPRGGFSATHVAIATIEKANSLINRLLEENELTNLGAVVIDELHLLGDPNRGYLLELLLTKIKYMTLRNNQIKIQLIGMSATLPNLSLLAKWLDAELYKTEFRPVPLNEQCKIGLNIYDNRFQVIRSLEPLPELSTDTDNILQLCIETISDGHSVLIFCPTKNWCEKLAEQIAVAFFRLGRESTSIGEVLKQQLNKTLILETLEQLKRSPTGLDTVLRNTCSCGVAFHHAGLTMDERDIIEGSFRSGSLRVLTATSTLSSGVNLPARRVIIRSPMFGGKLLDSLTYKQMIGRAGRMGRDTAGESILVCKPNERNAAESLLSASLAPIESCLEDSSPLIRALLEAVASEVVLRPEDLELYTKCTLISLSGKDDMKDPSQDAIQFLVDNEFLLLQTTEEECRWVATPLGKACLSASVSPREGLFLFEELQKARKCLVLDTELHVVYLVTPINPGSQITTIDWMTFMDLWRSISESERRVGQLVGVEERFIISALRGIVKPGKSLSIHRRFYTAMALHDLVRETPMNTVCRKYGCCRGVLQSLQQSAATFAGMVTQFCKQLGWDCMELLVGQFQTRLQFGVCRELLDLLRLPMLNGLRARSLYKHGITSVADLAIANELDVERALYKALPFESEKEQEGEDEREAAHRNKIRTVFVTGRDGLTPHEAAILLVKEARSLVQKELGLQGISWETNDQSSNSIENSVSHAYMDANQDKSEHQRSVQNTTKSKTDQLIHEEESPPRRESFGNVISRANITKTPEHVDGKTADKTESHETPPKLLSKSTKQESDRNNVESANTDVESSFMYKDSPLSRFSSNFETNSPEIMEQEEDRRYSGSLISFKGIRKRHLNNSHANSVISNPKSSADFNQGDKILDNDMRNQTTIKDTGEAVIVTKKNLKTPIEYAESKSSRSPSLFDDSLNLDTQMCNALEQNIIDSLHISEFEDSNVQSKLLATSSSGKTSSTDNRKNDSTPKAVNDAVRSQSDLLTWNDDSWNQTEEIVTKMIKSENINNISLKSTKKNTVTLNFVSETRSTDNIKSKTCKSLFTEKRQDTQGNKPIAFSPKINSSNFKASPIVPVCNIQRVSTDSNISDLDDIAIPSQAVDDLPLNDGKSKVSLETIRKVQTQKLCTPKTANDGKKTPKVASETVVLKARKVRPKLKEILARNILLSTDRSTDSIISNSDEDSPIKRVRAFEKDQIRFSPVQTRDIRKESDTRDLGITDWNKVNIINVGGDRGTFNLFKCELTNRTEVSLALSCEVYTNDTNRIGAKIIGSKKKPRKAETYVYGDTRICGAVISWKSNIAYYLSFTSTEESRIPAKEQMNLLKDLLSNTSMYVRCFASKDVYKLLYQCCEISANCKFLDPKVADWLCNTDNPEKNFSEMVSEYFPQACSIAKRLGVCYGIGPGLHIKSPLQSEFRSAAEAVLTWHIMEKLFIVLGEISPILLYTFKEVEMATVVLLARMELTGLGVSLKSLQELSTVIQAEMSSLEERAYFLAGKKFNFSSSKEVSQVLGLYKGKKISTNKAVLGQCDNPISTLVMLWRKLNATQSKIVCPLLNLAQDNSRIHGNCVTCTLTGRISMHEPNLQNVPKDFESEDKSFVISVRMAFVPAPGNVMLSADYCQLELRILAHFSKDPVLRDIMQNEGDIFKSIAAKWNHVLVEQVTDKMRQHTKQLCYGMIYGMGTKTLAETLSVTESEAKEFLESFMNTYPEIRKWLDEVLEEARKDGHVVTLLGRRRKLPKLSSTKVSERSQAERQAVNTKIQGSAADIAKKAMVMIDERIRNEFPNYVAVYGEKSGKRKLRSNSREAQQHGAYLVLQLHDELLYEVNSVDLKQVAIIVKTSMEQACQLEVPLPVKLKAGPTWGDLIEYEL